MSVDDDYMTKVFGTVATSLHDEMYIYKLLKHRGPKAAREKYKKVFGRAYNDSTIDREIEDLFLANFDTLAELEGDKSSPAEVISFIVHLLRRLAPLLLALILREGFAGRGPGTRKGDWQPLVAMRAMSEFRELRDKLKADGKPASYARDEAAKEVSKWSGLSVETIVAGRPNRKGRTSGRKLRP